MRAVVERPDEAREKGEIARRDIERLYAPAAVGEMIRERLEEIRGLWPASGPATDRVEGAQHRKQRAT